MSFRSKLALESAGNKDKLETEVAIYAKIGDLHELEACDHKEFQEQLETEFKNGVRCRTRKTTSMDGASSYEYTYKLKTKNDNAAQTLIEHSVIVDEAFHEDFKQVAERLLTKTRYIFNSKQVALKFYEGDLEKEVIIPNIKYEVDVYTKEDGTACDTCKIDVEVDSVLAFLSKEYPNLDKFNLTLKISHLPFAPFDPIFGHTENKDQKEAISNIWKEITRKVNL